MSAVSIMLTGLALVMVIEGLLYALFPGALRKLMIMAIAVPPEQLRLYGLGVAAAGTLLIWAVKALA